MYLKILVLLGILNLVICSTFEEFDPAWENVILAANESRLGFARLVNGDYYAGGYGEGYGNQKSYGGGMGNGHDYGGGNGYGGGSSYNSGGSYGGDNGYNSGGTYGGGKSYNNEGGYGGGNSYGSSNGYGGGSNYGNNGYGNGYNNNSQCSACDCTDGNGDNAYICNCNRQNHGYGYGGGYGGGYGSRKSYDQCACTCLEDAEGDLDCDCIDASGYSDGSNCQCDCTLTGGVVTCTNAAGNNGGDCTVCDCGNNGNVNGGLVYNCDCSHHDHGYGSGGSGSGSGGAYGSGSGYGGGSGYGAMSGYGGGYKKDQDNGNCICSCFDQTGDDDFECFCDNGRGDGSGNTGCNCACNANPGTGVVSCANLDNAGNSGLVGAGAAARKKGKSKTSSKRKKTGLSAVKCGKGSKNFCNYPAVPQLTALDFSSFFSNSGKSTQLKSGECPVGYSKMPTTDCPNNAPALIETTCCVFDAVPQSLPDFCDKREGISFRASYQMCDGRNFIVSGASAWQVDDNFKIVDGPTPLSSLTNGVVSSDVDAALVDSTCSLGFFRGTTLFWANQGQGVNINRNLAELLGPIHPDLCGGADCRATSVQFSVCLNRGFCLVSVTLHTNADNRAFQQMFLLAPGFSSNLPDATITPGTPVNNGNDLSNNFRNFVSAMYFRNMNQLAFIDRSNNVHFYDPTGKFVSGPRSLFDLFDVCTNSGKSKSRATAKKTQKKTSSRKRSSTRSRNRLSAVSNSFANNQCANNPGVGNTLTENNCDCDGNTGTTCNCNANGICTGTDTGQCYCAGRDSINYDNYNSYSSNGYPMTSAGYGGDKKGYGGEGYNNRVEVKPDTHLIVNVGYPEQPKYAPAYANKQPSYAQSPPYQAPQYPSYGKPDQPYMEPHNPYPAQPQYQPYQPPVYAPQPQKYVPSYQPPVYPAPYAALNYPEQNGYMQGAYETPKLDAYMPPAAPYPTEPKTYVSQEDDYKVKPKPSTYILTELSDDGGYKPAYQTYGSERSAYGRSDVDEDTNAEAKPASGLKLL